MTLILDGVKVLGALVTGANGGSGAALTTNVENAASDGKLYWGRWANASIVAAGTDERGRSGQLSGSISGATSLHYIFGTPAATLPSTGSAMYSFIGGTPSTSDGGSIGNGVTSGSFTANFLSNSIQAFTMRVDHNGIYNLSSNNIQIQRPSEFMNSVTFQSSGAGAYPVLIKGFFSGSNPVPERAGLSYQIQKPSDFIAGVAGFACTRFC